MQRCWFVERLPNDAGVVVFELTNDTRGTEDSVGAVADRASEPGALPAVLRGRIVEVAVSVIVNNNPEVKVARYLDSPAELILVVVTYEIASAEFFLVFLFLISLFSNASKALAGVGASDSLKGASNNLLE